MSNPKPTWIDNLVDLLKEINTRLYFCELRTQANAVFLMKTMEYLEKNEKQKPHMTEMLDAPRSFTLKESTSEKSLCTITGIAASTGYSRNVEETEHGTKQRYYDERLLKELEQKLLGAPLYSEHVSAFGAVGKVTRLWEERTDAKDELGKPIIHLHYDAEVYDTDFANKVKTGIVKRVSPAADYSELTVWNGATPHNIIPESAELSLVAVAGIPSTTASIKIAENAARLRKLVCGDT